jgi:hypothetical protein
VRWHVDNGPNHSPQVRIQVPGVYTWKVTTHASPANRSATHHCGQSAETTVVAKPAFIAPIVNGGFAGSLPHSQDRSLRSARTLIEMPGIGLDAPVLTERIRAGQMTLPSDVGKVGWLRKSAAVSDKIGTTVIAGHVSDRHDHPGAMFNLSRAHRGQGITIRHAGKNIRFTVVKTASFDRSHKLPHRYFTTTGGHRLVLISCTHRVTRPDGHFHYTRYQVVVAKLTRPIS